MSRQKSQPRCTTTVQFSPKFIDYLKDQSSCSGLSMGSYLESQIQKGRLGFKDRLEQLTSEKAELESKKAELIAALTLSEEQRVAAVEAEASAVVEAQMLFEECKIVAIKAEARAAIEALELSEERKVAAIRAETQVAIDALKLSKERKMASIKIEARAAVEAATQRALVAKRALSEFSASELSLISKRYGSQISELTEKERIARELYNESFEKTLFECGNRAPRPSELARSGVLWVVGGDGLVYSVYTRLGKFIQETLSDEKFSSREQAVRYILSLDRHELAEAELEYFKKVYKQGDEIQIGFRSLDSAFGTSYDKTLKNYLVALGSNR